MATTCVHRVFSVKRGKTINARSKTHKLAVLAENVLLQAGETCPECGKVLKDLQRHRERVHGQTT